MYKQFLIHFKRDGEMNFQAKFIGPFVNFDEAYDVMCRMPNITAQADDDGLCPTPGFKYIAEINTLPESP